MKKIILYLFIFLLTIAFVSAVQVCVVVDYNNGDVDSKCLDVAEDTSGYEVLQATGWDLLWTPESAFGRMLCKINGIGEELSGQWCAYNGKYWNFDTLSDKTWNHMMIGLSSYGAKEGDIIGLTFGPDLSHPNLIKINDVEVYVDGDKKSGIDEEGGNIKNVNPGSEIKLEIELENLYSDETNIELKDVMAKGVIKKIDDGDDIEEESDETDIDAEDKETIEIKFEIPLEVKDKNYDLELTIKGEDEKGIKYEKTVEFTVEIEKEKHDVKITKAELINPVVKCSRTTNLDVNLVNLGTEEEDVVLNVINNELELNKQLSFELDDNPFDSDSKYSATFKITVDSEQEAGVYFIILRADYSSKTTEKIVELNVEDCNEENTETITGQTMLQPQQTQQEKTAAKETAAKSDIDTIYNSNYFLIVFILGLIIVVTFGALLVAKLLR